MDSRVIKSRLVKRRQSYPPAGVRHDITTGLPLDSHLTHDLSMEIFRHPILASDEHRYEASTFLKILQTNGKSPYDRDHTFSYFTYDKQLKNNLDKFYGEHKDRCPDYAIAPVIAEAKYWIGMWNDKAEPIDLDAQQRFLPDASSSENDSDSESDDENAPYRRTFLGDFLALRARPTSCFFPPVAMWSRNLNNPLYNATANTFMVSEAVALCVAIFYLYDSKGGLASVGSLLLTCSLASCMFSMVAGSVMNFSDLKNLMANEDAQVLRL